MITSPYSRIMIAGTAGDTGKTIVSLGLLACWKERGLELRAFKKGPDFIDAAWLGWACGSSGRNLDTYMMAPEVAARSFREHGTGGGLNVIEGNRGLLDGVDATGTHSSASLARLLDCPVVLVVAPAKVTATAAAVVLGCRQLARDVTIAGVILNRVRSGRHEQVVRRAIQEQAGVPVLGALPPLEGGALVSRHLGLVPPAEHGPAGELRRTLAACARDNVDCDRLLAIARAVPLLTAAVKRPGPEPLEGAPDKSAPDRTRPVAGLDKGGPGPGGPDEGGEVRVGFFCDSAFTFYYPENLEALAAAGATLVAISALADRRLPPIDALYIGGGFPETHASELAGNRSLLGAVREAAAGGLPIYAECGGLMYLAESLQWQGKTMPLAGALPIRVRMHDEPQGHGYSHVVVDTPNPFLPVGTEVKGHEFHYSSLVGDTTGIRTAFAVQRGQGCLGPVQAVANVSQGRRDGIVLGGILASYLHLHALGVPGWAAGMVRAARSARMTRRQS